MCKHYGIIGHVVEKCYKLRGFPPSYKPKPKQQSVANHVVLNDNHYSAAIHQENQTSQTRKY